MTNIPEDSVLRRHFQSAMYTPGASATGSGAAQARSTHSPQPAATAPSSGGGLFGWLKKLLGG